MSDVQIPWGDTEWSRIRQVVHDEALRVRVAASFLPLYGPLQGGAETAPLNRLEIREPGRDGSPGMLAIDDHTTKPFASVSVNVHLKNHMLADPELLAATTLFRRAAGIVARVEDAILFNGLKGEELLGTDGVEAVYNLGGSKEYEGLATDRKQIVTVEDGEIDEKGQKVFSAVVKAVLALEKSGYHRPFAVVLAHDLFRDIHEPIPKSMVLPRDGIPPIIEGPLVRSSSLAQGTGLVISLQGDPVEIVVPSDISVRYLQASLDGSHVFRVSQRFLLRVKDGRAIAMLKRDKS